MPTGMPARGPSGSPLAADSSTRDGLLEGALFSEAEVDVEARIHLRDAIVIGAGKSTALVAPLAIACCSSLRLFGFCTNDSGDFTSLDNPLSSLRSVERAPGAASYSMAIAAVAAMHDLCA